MEYLSTNQGSPLFLLLVSYTTQDSLDLERLQSLCTLNFLFHAPVNGQSAIQFTLEPKSSDISFQVPSTTITMKLSPCEGSWERGTTLALLLFLFYVLLGMRGERQQQEITLSPGLTNGLFCLVRKVTLPRQPANLSSPCRFSQDTLPSPFFPALNPSSIGQQWLVQISWIFLSHSFLVVLVIIGYKKGAHQCGSPTRTGFCLFSSFLSKAWHTVCPQYFLSEWQHFHLSMGYSCTLFFFLITSFGPWACI